LRTALPTAEFSAPVPVLAKENSSTVIDGPLWGWATLKAGMFLRDLLGATNGVEGQSHESLLNTTFFSSAIAGTGTENVLMDNIPQTLR
jgi:hypothetical protein